VVVVSGGVKQTADHSENNKDIFYSLLSKLQLECSKYAEFMFN